MEEGSKVREFVSGVGADNALVAARKPCFGQLFEFEIMDYGAVSVGSYDCMLTSSLSPKWPSGVSLSSGRRQQ